MASIEALEKTCKAGDKATCRWIVKLDKHYEKLDSGTKVPR